MAVFKPSKHNTGAIRRFSYFATKFRFASMLNVRVSIPVRSRTQPDLERETRLEDDFEMRKSVVNTFPDIVEGFTEREGESASYCSRA